MNARDYLLKANSTKARELPSAEVTKENDVEKITQAQELLQQELQKKLREYEHLEEQKKVLSAKQRNSKPTQIQQITFKERQKGDKISSDLKMAIGNDILMYSTPFEQIVSKYNVGLSTVKKIKRETIDYYNNLRDNPDYKHVKTLKKVGRRSKISNEHVLHMYEFIIQNPTCALKDILSHMQSKFPDIPFSISTIWRHLDDCDITLKRTVAIPVVWNDPTLINERKIFASNFYLNTLNRNIIYVDETHFNLSRYATRGRQVKGKTPLAPIANFRTKSISMIAALSTQGFSHIHFVRSFSNQKRGTTAADFRTFLLNLVTKQGVYNSVLIMDNHSIHGEVDVKSAFSHLKQHYKIDVVFLPPHSPFLNPIEYSFQLIKEAVNKSSFDWNIAELQRTVITLVERFSQKNAIGCFAIGNYYRTICSLGLPFQGKLLNPTIDQLYQIDKEELKNLVKPDYNPFNQLSPVNPVSFSHDPVDSYEENDHYQTSIAPIAKSGIPSKSTLGNGNEILKNCVKNQRAFVATFNANSPKCVFFGGV